MKKRTMIVSTLLVLGLASCGAGVPKTTADKTQTTASIAKVSTSLILFNLVSSTTTLGAQATTNGSVSGTKNCNAGSMDYSVIYDVTNPNPNGTQTATATLKLKGTTCTIGKVTLSNVDLSTKMTITSTADKLSVKFAYSGGVTVKDQNETSVINFETLNFDWTATKINPTTIKNTYTIDGALTINGENVRYNNEVLINEVTDSES
jgi:hypothetical protein